MDTIPLKIFAIDPGTQDCGFSYYEDGKLKERGHIKSRGEEVYARCEKIYKELFYEISATQPDLVICERPLKNGPGARSGHIFVLHHFCGMLHGILAHHAIPFKYVEVSAWKGNLPKSIHHPRIIAAVKKSFNINLADESEDTIDAVGLGHWYVKELKSESRKAKNN